MFLAFDQIIIILLLGKKMSHQLDMDKNKKWNKSKNPTVQISVKEKSIPTKQISVQEQRQQQCSLMKLQQQSYNKPQKSSIPLYSLKQFHSTPIQVIAYFKKLSKQLKQNDFSHLLYEQEKIAQNINFLNRNWTIYEFDVEQQLGNFLYLVSIKLQNITYSDRFYSHLFQATKEIAKKIKIKKSTKRLPVQDKIADIVLKRYILELQKISEKEVDFIKIQDKGRSWTELMESLFFDQKWQQIYRKINHYHYEKQSDEATFMKRLQQKFNHNIQLQRTSSIDCLGCSKFYYKNKNIYDHEINNCKMVLMGSITQILKSASRVKQEICALLNSGGGVVLFNCMHSFLNVIPRGQFLSQNKKVQIKKILYNYLDSIHPRPNHENVQVTFVPIKEDPFENDHNGKIQKHIDNDIQYYERRYIKGLYVTRIKVNPTNGRTSYILVQDKTQNYIAIRIRSIFDSQKSKMYITGDQILKFIKNRQSQYDYETNKDYSEQKKKSLEKRYSDFDHICDKPDVGQLIYNIQQIQKKPWKERYHRFASILVCDHGCHQEIKLQLQKKNISCQIEMPYLDRDITTAILYYNAPQICNFDFLKFIKVIPIHDYINISQSLSINDENNLKQWLKIYHPKEKLYIQKFTNINNQLRIQLKSESKTSSALIFSLLMVNQKVFSPGFNEVLARYHHRES